VPEEHGLRRLRQHLRTGCRWNLALPKMPGLAVQELVDWLPLPLVRISRAGQLRARRFSLGSRA